MNQFTRDHGSGLSSTNVRPGSTRSYERLDWVAAMPCLRVVSGRLDAVSHDNDRCCPQRTLIETASMPEKRTKQPVAGAASE